MSDKRLNNFNWGRATRFFYSHKNQKSLWLEGTFEVDVALHLEFCSKVHAYISQPFSLWYRDGFMQQRRYTPDFLIQTFSRQAPFGALEAKKQKWFDMDTKFQALLPYITQALHEERQLPFRVVTEASIASGQRLANYKRLYHYKRIKVEKHLKIGDLSSSLGLSFSLGELRDFLEFKRIPDCVAGALLAHGQVSFDIEQPIKDTIQLEVA